MIHRVKDDDVASEPVGIVITGGRTTDVAPRFAAFIWGPVPDAEVQETTTTKAA